MQQILLNVQGPQINFKKSVFWSLSPALRYSLHRQKLDCLLLRVSKNTRDEMEHITNYKSLSRLLESCQVGPVLSRHCTRGLDELWAEAHVGVSLAELRICSVGFLRANDFPFSSCLAPWLVRQLEILPGDCTNSVCWRNNNTLPDNDKWHRVWLEFLERHKQ